MNTKKTTSGSRECPKCGSFMVTTNHAALADTNGGYSQRAKQLTCLDCSASFEDKLGHSPSSKWPRAAVLAILIVVVALALSFSKGLLESSNAPTDDLETKVVSPQPMDDEGLDQASSSPKSENSENADTATLREELGLNEADGLFDRRVDQQELSSEQAAQIENVLAAQADQVQTKLSLLEEELSGADVAERESLLRLTAARAVESWRSSWERGDFDSYLQMYSQGFSYNLSQTHAEWRSARQQRVTQNLPRSITLSDFETTCNVQTLACEVEFDQQFESRTFTDTSRKRISLINVSDSDVDGVLPRFKIASEILVE